jgi:hypothetical protein
MEPSTQCCREVADERASTAALQTLIPIAVVIAAGCESCATSMVERALSQGTPEPLIRRTLATVAYVRSRVCFAQAVGPDVVARMGKPLEAGTRALRGSRRSTQRAGGGR